MLLAWLAPLSLAWTPQLHDLRALVATEILLPRAVWFNERGPFGFETRAWQARVVIHCRPGGARVKKRQRATSCAVEQASLQAAALIRTEHDDPADTQRVLAEWSEALQQATVHLVTSERGRLLSWSVEGLPEGSARETGIGRTLAVVIERATAALILERPPEALPEAGQWIERASPLLRFPDLDTSVAPGVSEQLHQVSRVGEHVRIDAVGQANLIDPAADLQMRATARSRATLGSDGALLERTWNVDASSGPTVVYHHAGWLRRLSPDEAADTGPIRHVRAPGEAPEDEPLGLPGWPEL